MEFINVSGPKQLDGPVNVNTTTKKESKSAKVVQTELGKSHYYQQSPIKKRVFAFSGRVTPAEPILKDLLEEAISEDDADEAALQIYGFLSANGEGLDIALKMLQSKSPGKIESVLLALNDILQTFPRAKIEVEELKKAIDILKEVHGTEGSIAILQLWIEKFKYKPGASKDLGEDRGSTRIIEAALWDQRFKDEFSVEALIKARRGAQENALARSATQTLNDWIYEAIKKACLTALNTQEPLNRVITRFGEGLIPANDAILEFAMADQAKLKVLYADFFKALKGTSFDGISISELNAARVAFEGLFQGTDPENTAFLRTWIKERSV
ncbi:MAG TPA: hypothetical protein VLG76_01815 [Rhabdochlamydiaceae bacterium]|nr:hypothetical protein [Rhabdochlamydiaceae bacterium]